MKGLIALLLCIAPAAMASPRTRIPFFLTPGQKVAHAAAAPVLTVTALPVGTKAVSASFDRYRHEIRIDGRSSGEAKLLVEHADGRIGEILDVVVVAAPVQAVVRNVVAALTGLEGFGADSVFVRGKNVVIAGKAYSPEHLSRCRDATSLGRGDVKVVCVAGLAGAALAVDPKAVVTPSAWVDVEEGTPTRSSVTSQALEEEAFWTVTVRLGDVPIARLSSANRPAILGSAVDLAEGLNRIHRVWEERRGARAPYPVEFRAKCTGPSCTLSSVWSYEQGKAGEVIARFPHEAALAAMPGAAVPMDDLVSWWAALLEDAFHLYHLGEKPVRTATASSPSPLQLLYDAALRLGPGAGATSGAPQFGRAHFSLIFSMGEDPFDGVLAKVPVDFQISPR